MQHALSLCQQKYTLKSLVVYDIKSNTFSIDYFKIPSLCTKVSV